MRYAGYCTRNTSFSDEELDAIIEAETLVLAFCEGKGRSFDLVTTVIRLELNQMETFRQRRQEDR